MKRQADEELEGSPPTQRRPIDSLEPEHEEQPMGAMIPEEMPQEGPSTSGDQRGGALNPDEQPGGPVEVRLELNDEDIAIRDMHNERREENRRNCEERRRRREAAVMESLDSSISNLPRDHPHNFFSNQIERLEKMKCRKIRLIKIWVTRIRVSKTSTTVIPRIFVLIGFDAGIDDLISYRPSEENTQNCIIKRRGNPVEMIVRDENYQDVLSDDLLFFLMACGDLYTTIGKIEFVVDSNPLIPANRLSWRSNGPEDSFLEQFRSLWLAVDHNTLLIKTVEIESRFRPLVEAFELVRFAPCINVIVRPLKFERENVAEVMETLGVFGPASVVNNWHIETRDDIENNLRYNCRVPNFNVFSPCPDEIVFKQTHPTPHRIPVRPDA